MEKTKNYKIFEHLECNRKIDENALKKLMESIQSRNLLAFRPISVNDKMQVIDGQHRLEAARRLNLEIYYEVQKDLKVSDIILLNNNQKQWKLDDYLNYWCENGNDEYLKLKRYLEETHLKINLALKLLNGNTGQTGPRFRSGKFVFPDEKNMEEIKGVMDNIILIKDYIKKKLPSIAFITKTSNFTTALVEFLNIKSNDFETFFKKFQFKLDLLRPCSRKIDYYLIFREINNWRKRHIEIEEEEKSDEKIPPLGRVTKARAQSLFDRL